MKLEMYLFFISIMEYKKLYEQSQGQLQKYKKQNKKLQEEINHRCRNFYVKLSQCSKKNNRKFVIESLDSVSYFPTTKQKVQDPSMKSISYPQDEYFDKVIAGLKERIKNLHILKANHITQIQFLKQQLKNKNILIEQSQKRISEAENTIKQKQKYEKMFKQIPIRGEINQIIEKIKDLLDQQDKRVQKDNDLKVNTAENSPSPCKRLEQSSSFYKEPITEKKSTLQTKNIDPPYIIEEDIDFECHPFVKRSFLRKKVIKRHFSTFALPTQKESKEKIGNMKRKVQQIWPRRENSDGIWKKIDHCENILDEKGKQMSRNMVGIVEVETQMIGKNFYSAHIFENL